MVKNLPANAGNASDAGLIPGSARPLGVGNGTRIPWAEEPGGLQSTGSQRVRYD